MYYMYFPLTAVFIISPRQDHWALRDHPNLKFVWFEDMKADFEKYFEELQHFLGHRVRDAEHKARWDMFEFGVMFVHGQSN